MDRGFCSVASTKFPGLGYHLAGVASLMSRPKTPTDALKASCHSPASFFVCSLIVRQFLNRNAKLRHVLCLCLLRNMHLQNSVPVMLKTCVR